jgi:hypothetical protein
LRPQLAVQLVGKFAVIEMNAAMWIEIVQLGAYDGAAEIIRHQLADLARLDDVGLYRFKPLSVRLERCRNDRAAGEPALYHFLVGGIRGEQAGYVRAVDAGEEKHLVRQPLQRVEKFRLKDIAVL